MQLLPNRAGLNDGHRVRRALKLIAMIVVMHRSAVPAKGKGRRR